MKLTHREMWTEPPMTPPATPYLFWRRWMNPRMLHIDDAAGLVRSLLGARR